MMITKKHLPRRTVLRGLGVTIALPLLDGMVPALTALSQTAAAPVRRFAAAYVPHGMNMDMWTPSTEGRSPELPLILKAFEPVREQLLVLSGFDSRETEPRYNDGDAGGVHTRAMATWLTGVRPRKTAGSDLRLAVTADQIAAEQVGDATQLRSLELALEEIDTAGSCDYGYACAYTSTMSWRSAQTPLPMETSPRVVFERLFGDSGTTNPKVLAARARKDRSILDAVTEDLASLRAQVGPQDRLKLTEYFDAARDVEQRIQKAEEQGAVELPLVEQPVGIPAKFADYAQLMFDMLVLAYQSDMTRIGTVMMGREMSGRVFPEIGVMEPHHPLSHHNHNPEQLAVYSKVNIHQTQQLAYFTEKLNSIPDGDGTLLDHTMVLYGSGFSDASIHKYLDLPTILVGGKALGIRGDRHIRFAEGTPLANVLLTVLDRLGVQVDHVGDSSGQLDLVSV